MSLRFYYLRDQVNIRVKDNGFKTRGNPIVCIVSEFNPDTKELRYGYSAAHPTEKVLSKSRAKEIAVGRFSKRAEVITDVSAKNNHEINKVIVADLITSAAACFSKPKRFVEVAKLWLDGVKEDDAKRQEQTVSLSAS